MISGMTILTFIHVVLSLVGIFSGFVVVFVLIVQLFEKVPGLKAIAPTLSEPPFRLAQLFALEVFLLVGILVSKRFVKGQIQAA